MALREVMVGGWSWLDATQEGEVSSSRSATSKSRPAR